MPNDIVRYSNDFNRLNLSALSVQEHNLLIEILLKLKDKRDETVVFSHTELNAMIPFRNVNRKELTEHVEGLKNKFFSLNLSNVIENEWGGESEIFINLFQVMRIDYDRKKTDPHRLVKTLELKVNAQCVYMLNDLTKNFTRFELAEFVSLQSKFSKRLFCQLKQYRTQGWAIFDWEEFKSFMGVPKGYRATNIEQRILRPAVKELSWDFGQPDMFKDYHGCDHPAFKNLTYEKIRSKDGKGRGIKQILFRFDKEVVPVDNRKKGKKYGQEREISQVRRNADGSWTNQNNETYSNTFNMFQAPEPSPTPQNKQLLDDCYDRFHAKKPELIDFQNTKKFGRALALIRYAPDTSKAQECREWIEMLCKFRPDAAATIKQFMLEYNIS